TLDHLIAERAKRRLEPGVRAALQLGLFQLVFLDGVAERAAIAESVELAKPSPGHRLVNAVLRRVQREGVELPDDTTPAGAAIRHSHPEWLVRMWWKTLGAGEARALLAANNLPAELALRVNPLVDFDLSDVRRRHPGRARALEATCERMRARNVRVVVADAATFHDERGFDRVLLDPPCSGLGTLRSHPDLRWRASPEGIASLAALQDRMLASARRNLRAGGPQALVYS